MTSFRFIARGAFAAASLLMLALLSSCATYGPSVPVGYTGPTAQIADSAQVHSSSKVDDFYVHKIDGREVKNSRHESIARNQGLGFYMEPHVLDRAVPAQSVTVEVMGRTEYAAPILALTLPVYQVKGAVTFTPEAGKRYMVKG